MFRYRCKKKAHTRTGQKWADEDGKKSIEADFDKVRANIFKQAFWSHLSLLNI